VFSHVYWVEGSGQVLGSLHLIFGPWRRGRPVRAGDQRGSDRLRSDAQLSNGRGSGTDAPQAPAAASRDPRVGVEDEQGNGLYFSEPAQQNLHLLGGHLVGVLGGPEALHVEGGGPTLADEVELCDELVGPSGHDRLAGRVARRMVIVALTKGCTPRRIWATRSCPRRRRALLRSQRADGGRADCAGPPHRYVHAPEPRRSFPIRVGAQVGGSNGQEKGRRRPHRGWRRSVRRERRLCGGGIRKASGGSCGEHRKVP
jgi:hypothetical protein